MISSGKCEIVGQTYAQAMRNECFIGRLERLTPIASELLGVLLMSHPDHEIAETEIIARLWPHPDFGPQFERDNMKAHLQQLRNCGVPIVNRHGFGWRIPARHRR